jgi:hypothetical protein
MLDAKMASPVNYPGTIGAPDMKLKPLAAAAVFLLAWPGIAAAGEPGPFTTPKPKAEPVEHTAPGPEQPDTQCAMVVRWDPDTPQFPKLVFVGGDRACYLTRNTAAKAAKILVDCTRVPTESCITVP